MLDYMTSGSYAGIYLRGQIRKFSRKKLGHFDTSICARIVYVDTRTTPVEKQL